MSPQSGSLWDVDYFELKLLKKQLVQERCSEPPLPPPKAGNVSPTWDFPGGPVAKTPCFPCRGPRFNAWSGFTR